MESVNKFSIFFFVPKVLVISALLKTSEYENLTKTTPEMIAEEGYTVETHWVITSDRYTLCIHRIPTGRKGETNRKVAFLMHGLLSSSSDYILFGPGKSLGYILADEGYDVWMGNARGNIYSRNYTTYNTDEETFWKFSWNEIGEIDLPTMIDYVLSTTGVDGVYYVGYSQGTTSFFVMTSEKPEYNQKIKVQASLAPVAYIDHMKSVLVYAAVTILNFFDVHELFFISTGLIHELQVEFCNLLPVVCQYIIFASFGFSFRESNLNIVPLIAGHFPAGSSFMELNHYKQEFKNGTFRKYDFGVNGNLEKYGMIFPPRYDLRKITAPVFIYYSKNDLIADVDDVKRLYEELGNPVGKLLIADDTFSHVDFVYGVHAPELVYQNILSLFKKY